MRTTLMVLLGCWIAILNFGSHGPAWAQNKQAAPRSFDYWQPDWMVRDLWGPGKMPKGMMVRLLRHTIFVQYGVPKNYAGATATTASKTPDSIAAGGKLYTTHCASCHGADGMGGGDPSQAVSPSPALLAYMIKRPISVDAYLLWAIADGGEQFRSEMPAFKDEMSRDEIWQIVAYMRAGFPAAGTAPKQ